MPFPPEVDAKIRRRLQQIQARAAFAHNDSAVFVEVRTQLFTLMHLISPSSEHFARLREEINLCAPTASNHLIGYVAAIKRDYELGMFDPSAIEVAVITDYMAQAERLLGEGKPGKYDHIPAAVLAGAILEDSLRRLCQRQDPPISLLKPDGAFKTLDPLIGELQKGDVINKAKADQLRGWTKIRNYAAHGEFAAFSRGDVEVMLVGVKTFIAEFL